MHLRTSLKVALFSIPILLVLAIFLIVTLLYTDPARLKDQIESLASQQGLDLKLSGDIGWSIYPNIQFVARGATAGYDTSSMHLDAQIGYLNFALKPWPALRGEIEFVGIEVSDAVIDLQLEDTEEDEEGEDGKGLEQSMEDASVLLPPTKIGHLELVNVTLNLTTAEADASSGEPMSIQIHKLAAQDIASDGDTFPIQGDLEVITLPPLYRQFEFEGHLLVEPDAAIYAADFSELSIRGELDDIESQIEGTGDINLDLNRNQWSGEINLVDQDSSGLNATYTGALSPIIGEGRVELNVSELNAWAQRLGFAGDEPLPAEKLVVDTDYSLDEELIQLQNLRVRADEYSGRGEVTYGIAEKKTLQANLAFDQLDLNPYLNAESEPAAGSVQPISGDSADRFEAIREFDELDIELDIGLLQFADREVEQLQVITKLKEGVGELTVPTARFAGGGFALNLDVDLADNDQISNIQMNLSGLQLEALGVGTDEAQVDGTLDLSYEGSIDLAAGPELAEGLQGEGRINFTELTVRNLNIEQMLCEAGEVFGTSPAAVVDWPAGTALGDVASDYAIRRGRVTIDEFGFRYGNMDVLGKTQLSLVDKDYDLRFTVEVNAPQTSENGCNLNKYAQGVPLPLQCTGSFDTDGQKSCGVDAALAEKLVFEQVGDRIIEGLLDQVIDRADDEPQDGLQEQEPSDDRNELRSLLEGVLRGIGN